MADDESLLQHAAIGKLQSDVEYIKRDVAELRADMRELRAELRDLRDGVGELRDRVVRLEVRVDHLPTKGFIVTAVIVALTIIGGLVTIAPKLQGWAGTAPVATDARAAR